MDEPKAPASIGALNMALDDAVSEIRRAVSDLADAADMIEELGSEVSEDTREGTLLAIGRANDLIGVIEMAVMFVTPPPTVSSLIPFDYDEYADAEAAHELEEQAEAAEYFDDEFETRWHEDDILAEARGEGH